MHESIRATPSAYFAIPPYTVEPANPSYPEGLQCVMNANGFNCLSFPDKPGAKFTSKDAALSTATKWNQLAKGGK